MSIISHHARPEDYDALTILWRETVVTTHKFLKATDIDQIQRMLPVYFDAVNLLTWFDGEKLIGFSGTKNYKLEMLFLDVRCLHQGYGSQILERLINEDHIQTVDVNEQNPDALAFYQHNGFHIANRDAEDNQGRSFPILHLKLT